MYVEMKSSTGRLQDPQREFGELLTGQGYRVIVCRSWGEARDAVLAYLAQSNQQPKGRAHYRQEGYFGHFSGRTLDDCPYPGEATEAAAWKEGWTYRAGAGISMPGMPARNG
ncbi:MAG: hypothetical protein A2286_05800 [Gammaproteobacteria bacterium RIFOXYA12_FULL_61_12]|nr:MAG: hypothetical protein A2286_05800 [Gammaproteobacteria bacterium RIFOXYA12_FULL_61_12]OGT89407.1 MAG: hypothetical protein A2514_15860 [Gammaproteobacteria bacterium RIFOXYD12_FULL_61_37]